MSYQDNEPGKQRSSCDYYADYDSTIEALRAELESGRQNAENSKPGSRDPADILPAWIFCPQRSRSPVTAIRFENCEVESDLPVRFLFGRLVPGSFKQLPTGFSARYVSSYIDMVVSGDGDKLRFEVKIERSDPCYHVCHYWNMNWNPGLLNQLTATKSDFDRAFKQVIETDFNAVFRSVVPVLEASTPPFWHATRKAVMPSTISPVANRDSFRTKKQFTHELVM
jgi:hypothetical protein